MDKDAIPIVDIGTLRVVLYWARHNSGIPNPYPLPTEKLADKVAEALSRSSNAKRHRTAVWLGHPVVSGVKENDMQVERLDNKEFTFVFHYAHPAWLLSGGAPSRPVPTSGPALDTKDNNTLQ